MVANTALIDPYDAYQKLDDAWAAISIDLEVLGSEGFDAVRAVDPNMVIKKKGGKDVEVQDGWIGRVLPFDWFSVSCCTMIWLRSRRTNAVYRTLIPRLKPFWKVSMRMTAE